MILKKFNFKSGIGIEGQKKYANKLEIKEMVPKCYYMKINPKAFALTVAIWLM